MGYSLNNKNGMIVANAFQKFLNKTNGKPNKICVNEDNGFCNRSMKLYFQDNYIEMYSTFNEKK